MTTDEFKQQSDRVSKFTNLIQQHDGLVAFQNAMLNIDELKRVESIKVHFAYKPETNCSSESYVIPYQLEFTSYDLAQVMLNRVAAVIAKLKEEIAGI